MKINKFRIGLGIISLSLLIVGGCDFNAKNKVLAKIDNETITQAEFQAKLDRLPAYYRALAKEQKGKFLDELVNEKLFLKEAYRKGVDKNKEVKELVAEARNKIIIAKFIEEELSSAAKVSDKDVEEYYNAHKKEFISLPRFRASHILVSTQQEAKEVLERLKQPGADFSSIAKEVSIDPSKSNGGDLGYFTEGQMIPDFESACFKLEVGQTSDIVKTQFGYHIIKLTDKKPASTKTLSEVSDQIKRKILDSKKMEKLQDVIKDIRARANIKINQDFLKSEDDKNNAEQ